MSRASQARSFVALTLAEYRHLLRALDAYGLVRVGEGKDRESHAKRHEALLETMRRKVRQIAEGA